MSKQNQILAAVLALQIVLLAVVYWPSSSTTGKRLFSGLTVDQVVQLVIQDAAGERIVLTRGTGGWVLPEADDYPAKGDQIVTLLDKIVGIRGDRVVAQTGDSRRRLKVADDEYERLIEFELEGGVRHKLYVGTSPRYQVLHVRADDQDDVYLALGLTHSEIRAEATAWVDATYFSVPREQIVVLTLQNQNGRFEFEKDVNGEWLLKDLAADETLNPNNVTTLVSRVTSVQMQWPLGKEERASYGLDNPSAVVTVETRDEGGDERTHILRVGAEQEDGGYVVKSVTSPFFVLVADYTVSNFVERTRADFLQLPPTPVPTEAP